MMRPPEGLPVSESPQLAGFENDVEALLRDRVDRLHLAGLPVAATLELRLLVLRDLAGAPADQRTALIGIEYLLQACGTTLPNAVTLSPSANVVDSDTTSQNSNVGVAPAEATVPGVSLPESSAAQEDKPELLPNKVRLLTRLLGDKPLPDNLDDNLADEFIQIAIKAYALAVRVRDHETTDRHIQVVRLYATGKTMPQIADELGYKSHHAISMVLKRFQDVLHERGYPPSLLREFLLQHMAGQFVIVEPIPYTPKPGASRKTRDAVDDKLPEEEKEKSQLELDIYELVEDLLRGRQVLSEYVAMLGNHFTGNKVDTFDMRFRAALLGFRGVVNDAVRASKRRQSNGASDGLVQAGDINLLSAMLGDYSGVISRNPLTAEQLLTQRRARRPELNLEMNDVLLDIQGALTRLRHNMAK